MCPSVRIIYKEGLGAMTQGPGKSKTTESTEEFTEKSKKIMIQGISA